MPSTRSGTTFCYHVCWPGVCIPVWLKNSLAWLITRQAAVFKRPAKAWDVFITEHVYFNIKGKCIQWTRALIANLSLFRFQKLQELILKELVKTAVKYKSIFFDQEGELRWSCFDSSPLPVIPRTNWPEPNWRSLLVLVHFNIWIDPVAVFLTTWIITFPL